MIESATQLNTPGIRLADMEGVHALTDVTGYGLLGHLLEICRGSQLAARIAFDALPILSAARHLAEAGYATGASDRNWTSFGEQVALPADWPAWRRKLLTDPQTSGGLLVACDPAAAPAVLDIFKSEGFERAARIGTLEAGAPRVVVVLIREASASQASNHANHRSLLLQKRPQPLPHRVQDDRLRRRPSGWTLSGWKYARLSAKPSNMKGTSGTLRLAATSP